MTPPRGEVVDRGAPRFRDLSLRQRLLLAAVLLLLPLLLAAVLEGVLRLAGYGDDYPLFVPHPRVEGYLLPNEEVGRRYFVDPDDAPRPHMDPLLVEKTPETFRVVVQGASSAAGFPYYFGGAFSRMLGQRLRQTFPDRRIEVVNVALDATNSYAILDLVDEIIAVEPDAVLLYAGHNEFYGTFGVASAQSVGRAGPVVRAYLTVRRLRLVQLLRDGIGHVRGRLRSSGAAGDGHATLMERLAGERSVRWGSPLHDAGLRQLSDNLERILGRYGTAGVPVYIGTPASNERDLEPFVSEPREGTDRAAWDAGVARARAASARGEHHRALELLDRLVAIDSLAPLPHYLRGRALESRSGTDAATDPARSAAAAEAYFLGRDYDQLPFRASRAVEDTIRSVAARHGAVVVETRERLAAESPGRVLGREIFLEHVHPRIEGQLLLADAFYRSLEEEGALGGWEKRVPLDSARARVPVTVLDSLAGEYWIERLTASFPFRSSDAPPVVRADTMRPSTAVEALAVALYRRELPWPEAQRRLYEHHIQTGEYDRALHTARVLGDELPFWEGALLMAGRAALAAGRRDEALAAFFAADSLQPTTYGDRMIGALLASGGDRGRARPYFERAARGTPSGSEARVALRAFDAIPLLEERAREESGEADVWADLAGTYFLTGQYRRAEAAAGRALEVEPGHSDAAAILQRAQQARTASAGTPPVPTTTDPAKPDPSGRTR